MEDKLTHWRSLTNAEYIGAYSLNAGEERTVEIISVSKKKVKGGDGREDECIVAELKNEKPFILNRTNCKTLQKVFGSPHIENWVNKKIIIYAENVKAFGEVVDALRIRPTKPILPELLPTSPKWIGAIEAIHTGKITLEKIQENYFVSTKNQEVIKKELVKLKKLDETLNKK